MKAPRPQQFNRLDKDIAEISSYFEGEPIVINVIPIQGVKSSHRNWDNEFRVSCSLPSEDYVFYLEGVSNTLDGAVANLHRRVKEHERANQ